MAVPLQKPNQKPRQGRNANVAPRRLVRRQVRSNAEFRRAFAWVAIATISVLFTMAILSVFAKAGVSQMNYSINSVKAENERLLLENDRIRGQIAELRSLDRIEAIAKRDLGMVKNEQIEYMVLSTTIVSEGKIRKIEGEEAGQTSPDSKTGTYKAMEKALDFILNALKK